MAKLGRKPGPNPLYQEPKRLQKSRFSMPKLSPGDLADLVADYGGLAAVCRDFRIGDDLLNRYLVGQMVPPYTLLCAIYWHTADGFRQGFAEAHWTHQYNTFLRHRAEAKVQMLEQVLQHAVLLLEQRADAVELIRESLRQLAPSAERYAGDPPKVGGSPSIRDGARSTGTVQNNPCGSSPDALMMHLHHADAESTPHDHA